VARRGPFLRRAFRFHSLTFKGTKIMMLVIAAALWLFFGWKLALCVLGASLAADLVLYARKAAKIAR
jgi:hypothetical protein